MFVRSIGYRPGVPAARTASDSSRIGSSRAGSNGERSTLDDTPSHSSSAIALPLAGAFSMPQQLWPVARKAPGTPGTAPSSGMASAQIGR